MSATSQIRKRPRSIADAAKPKDAARAKILRVTCTNIEISEIVKPIIEATSWFLCAATATALPDLNSISAHLKPTKVKLAEILSNVIHEEVSADEIGGLTATVSPSTGNCVVTLTLIRYGLVKVVQPYNLNFLPACKEDMFHGFMMRHKNAHPSMLRVAIERL
jgi:hypothetical protein